MDKYSIPEYRIEVSLPMIRMKMLSMNTHTIFMIVIQDGWVKQEFKEIKRSILMKNS
jgi:hypothetical protein